MDWYIVPYAVVGPRFANLHFTPGAKRRPKYGKYLEAWHLLLDAAKARTEGPIDIHACCDDDDAGRDRSCPDGCGPRNVPGSVPRVRSGKVLHHRGTESQRKQKKKQ